MREYDYHLVEEVRAGRLTRRQLIVRASVAGLSASAIGTLLAACGGGSGSSSSGSTSAAAAAAGPVKRGGTFRVGCAVPTSDVDPVFLFDQGGIFTAQLAGETLCKRMADTSLQPRLATAWKQVGNAKEWEFTIRQGVRWHDGSPLTVDDVVATMKMLSDPKVGSSALSAFSGVLSPDGVRKVDDQTVHFTLDRAYVDFPYTVSDDNYNSIILPAGYKKGSFSKGGIGTGPFVLKTLTPKQGATFVANPNWWGKDAKGGRLPYLAGVQVKYFNDPQSTVLALQSGGVDTYPQMAYATARGLFKDPNVRVLTLPSSEHRTVAMRTDQKPFDDKRVRQALAWSIDREALVKGLFGGNAKVGNDHTFAPVYPFSPSGTEVPQRKQDYAKAKQLLADAGHAGGVSVPTLIVEEFLDVPEYAQLIQDQAKGGGINMQLHQESQSIFYNKVWLQTPFGIVDWGGRGSISPLIEPAYTKKGIWNSSHWKNDDFDKLVAQFDSEADEGRRKQIAAQAAKIQNDETPTLISFFITGLRGVRKNVQGLENGPVDHMDASKVWLSGPAA
jgi:peptide/nickel transport system substrate-binding protein